MGNISNQIGSFGEELACQYLEQKGFQIIERNYRSQLGEIDLIAFDKDFLVFIEVKNYSFRSYGMPFQAITKTKKQSLVYTAKNFLFKNKLGNPNSRFDVITIYTEEDGTRTLEHFENAFFAR